MKTQNFGRSPLMKAGGFTGFLCRNRIPWATFGGIEVLTLICCSIKTYRKNRENGDACDNPNRLFPSAGFDDLDIKGSNEQENKWPDSKGRYWWKLTLQDESVNNDFYWMRDVAPWLSRTWFSRSLSDSYWFAVYHAPTNTKIEGFSEEPDYEKGFPTKEGYFWRYIKFTDTHCPAIRQWMEEKDKNYLARLEREKGAQQDAKTVQQRWQKEEYNGSPSEDLSNTRSFKK